MRATGLTDRRLPCGRRIDAVHFHCASGFRVRLPMTRAHARLLGPCFKTGPVSARNKTTADRDESSTETTRLDATLDGGPDALTPSSTRRAPPLSFGRQSEDRRIRSSFSTVARESRRRGSRSSRRRSPGLPLGALDSQDDGSRCYTKGEVHAL